MLNLSMFGYPRSGGGSSSAPLAAEAGSTGRRAQREVQHLEDRFERLSLVCMAMWSLLQDKTNLTEQDLLERVQSIDLMDGVGDGKAGKVGVVKCGSCDRPMSSRHLRCIYCGADKPSGSAFDRV
jgi:hypothetical protein